MSKTKEEKQTEIGDLLTKSILRYESPLSRSRYDQNLLFSLFGDTFSLCIQFCILFFRFFFSKLIWLFCLAGGRYSVLPNGELHVHRITDDLSATSIVSSSSPRHTSSISGSSSSVSGGSATSAVAASSSLASSFSQSNQNTSGARRLMFRCQTKHMLSGQVKLSANYGRLIVTGNEVFKYSSSGSESCFRKPPKMRPLILAGKQ